MTTAAIIVGLAAWFALFEIACCARGHDLNLYTMVCRRCMWTAEHIRRHDLRRRP